MGRPLTAWRTRAAQACFALVLRKYLTLMLSDRKVSQRTILQEWNAVELDQSLS